MKQKYEENGFNSLRIRERARLGGYSADPSFISQLWMALELWFIRIAEIKRQEKKKPLLRNYDLWLHANKLHRILIELKGGYKR